MSNKKCPNTLSGKHMWEYANRRTLKTVDIAFDIDMTTLCRKCVACGFIDDTPLKGSLNSVLKGELTDGEEV